MNQVAARNAAQPARIRTDGQTTEVTTARTAKCIQRYVLAVEKIPRFLSNQVETDRFIAAIASGKTPTANTHITKNKRGSLTTPFFCPFKNNLLLPQ